MYELTVEGKFASAHFLREYQGKCENLHGHTWKVSVVVGNNDLDKIGMVVDFKILKQELKDLLEEFDHKCINDHAYFKDNNPTTENIAKYIFDTLGEKYAPAKVKKVTVWESDSCSATYYE